LKEFDWQIGAEKTMEVIEQVIRRKKKAV